MDTNNETADEKRLSAAIKKEENRISVLDNYRKEFLRTKEFYPAIDDDEHNIHKSAKTSDHHIMYKLITDDQQRTWLENNDGTSRYEFLFEFSKANLDAGIYYGCKCLTIRGNHKTKVEEYLKQWNEIKEIVLVRLQTELNFDITQYMIEYTSNQNDNTFWPFWIHVAANEVTFKTPVNVLRIIKDSYEAYLAKDFDFLKGKVISPAYKEIKTAILTKNFTTKDGTISEPQKHCGIEIDKTLKQLLDFLSSDRSTNFEGKGTKHAPILKGEDKNGFWKINSRKAAECNRYISIWVSFLKYKYDPNTKEANEESFLDHHLDINRDLIVVPWSVFSKILRDQKGSDLKNKLKNAIGEHHLKHEEMIKRYNKLKEENIINYTYIENQ